MSVVDIGEHSWVRRGRGRNVTYILESSWERMGTGEPLVCVTKELGRWVGRTATSMLTGGDRDVVMLATVDAHERERDS